MFDFDFDLCTDEVIAQYFLGGSDDEDVTGLTGQDAPCRESPWEEMKRVLCGGKPLALVAAKNLDHDLAAETPEGSDDESESTSAGDEAMPEGNVALAVGISSSNSDTGESVS
mmetsp:Transcript_20209/g.47147  ORF Transcript_20209/g.47147 Transcript_20209/m.47147 type:complete len:113 (-) Transcript_20209:113-451(-)